MYTKCVAKNKYGLSINDLLSFFTWFLSIVKKSLFQTNNSKNINVIMVMDNLIEYSDNYSKTSGGLWQFYRDDPNDNITEPESFKSKTKISWKTPDADNKKCCDSSSIKIFN